MSFNPFSIYNTLYIFIKHHSSFILLDIKKYLKHQNTNVVTSMINKAS